MAPRKMKVPVPKEYRLSDIFIMCVGAITEAFEYIDKSKDKSLAKEDCLCVLSFAQKTLIENSEQLNVRCRLDMNGSYSMDVLDEIPTSKKKITKEDFVKKQVRTSRNGEKQSETSAVVAKGVSLTKIPKKESLQKQTKTSRNGVEQSQNKSALANIVSRLNRDEPKSPVKDLRHRSAVNSPDGCRRISRKNLNRKTNGKKVAKNGSNEKTEATDASMPKTLPVKTRNRKTNDKNESNGNTEATEPLMLKKLSVQITRLKRKASVGPEKQMSKSLPLDNPPKKRRLYTENTWMNQLNRTFNSC